jgi:hypothetical protein
MNMMKMKIMRIIRELPPREAIIRERYRLCDDCVEISISKVGDEMLYYVCEPDLDPKEISEYERLVDMLRFEMRPPPMTPHLESFIKNEIRRIQLQHRVEIKPIEKEILYFIFRDLTYSSSIL